VVLKITKNTWSRNPKSQGYLHEGLHALAHFGNHESDLQSSVEVTTFFTSNSSARAVPKNCDSFFVGSACPPHLHTTDVIECRKGFDLIKCRDGTFYRLQGSYADPQNSELYMLYIIRDVCWNVNSVLLLYLLFLFLNRLVYKGTRLCYFATVFIFHFLAALSTFLDVLLNHFLPTRLEASAKK
jgi:hypothetical protein